MLSKHFLPWAALASCSSLVHVSASKASRSSRSWSGREHVEHECVGSATGQEEAGVTTDHLLMQLGTTRSAVMKEQVAAEAAEVDATCQGMHDVEKQCPSSGCLVLATNMRGRSCADFCESNGRVCQGAWEEVEENCAIKYNLSCADSHVPTSDLLCLCAPPSTPAAAPPPASLPLRTFFWNVHWECSLAAHGAKGTCKRRIGRRFAELARAAQADVVASVELSEGSSRPSSLVGFGLAGWTQVDGPCAHGSRGDAAALAFSPRWRVEGSDGGCLRTDSDTRAFAVARVVPPRPVRGCPRLCIVALHAPHSSITAGHDKVRRVCGDAVEQCVVAMGDWNVPARHVHRLWSQLIGGKAPHAVGPDVRTCCYPESQHYGVFDHLATNIPGAAEAGHRVHPYQLLAENPVKQHRAVAARLSLPIEVALLEE